MTAFNVVDRVYSRAASTSPSGGQICIGPLRIMTLQAVKNQLARHELSTGNDATLSLSQDESGELWLIAQGENVTGYLLEAESFGLEACEESVEDFLMSVGLEARIIKITGQYCPAEAVTITTNSTYMIGSSGMSHQCLRIRHEAGMQQCIFAQGGPVLVANQGNGQNYQSQFAKSQSKVTCS